MDRKIQEQHTALLFDTMKACYLRDKVLVVHLDITQPAYKQCMLKFHHWLREKGEEFHHSETHVLDFYHVVNRLRRNINVELVVPVNRITPLKTVSQLDEALSVLEDVPTFTEAEKWVFELFFNSNIDAMLMAIEGEENKRVLQTVLDISRQFEKSILVKEVPVISLLDLPRGEAQVREAHVACVLASWF